MLDAFQQRKCERIAESVKEQEKKCTSVKEKKKRIAHV
jgi:hypothetical protein